MEIATERVQIPTNAGGHMGGYLARPTTGEPRPAVLVFMEIFGINSHIRDVTERVAREGYLALAPDFFHRTGPGIELGYDEAGFGRGMPLLGALRADEMVQDASDAAAWLRGRPDVRGDRLGAMGFCIGGHMTYLAACELDLRAAASFYGGGIAGEKGPGGQTSTLARTGKIRGRILCLYGEKDSYIPQDQVEAIRAALSKAGKRFEIAVYPGADHGFFRDPDATTYQEKAASDAWERVKRLFREELAG